MNTYVYNRICERGTQMEILRKPNFFYENTWVMLVYDKKMHYYINNCVLCATDVNKMIPALVGPGSCGIGIR